MRMGVDTGGTFTDFVWLDADGRFRIHKQLSTPQDPSQAILSGIAGLNLPEDVDVVHGSTVATNALLERRGARTALIATAGFADVLAIGRQNRPELYALVPQKPEPLVPQAWRFELHERVSARGEILVPWNPEELRPIIARIAADSIESVAVCLLFSFLRPQHEQEIRRAIEEWAAQHRRQDQRSGRDTSSGRQPPAMELHISLSSEVMPEYREYERTAATVINAYVAPLMGRYLSRLASGLRPRRLTVMQSNGGVISAQTGGAHAARTVLSGPAGGVVGARFVANRAGFKEIITFDMGGTSTDVALCPGRLPTTSDGEIAGMPLRLPMIDIHTVGAGGGSLAYVDAAGALHVGPQSAGADPGPSCYGRDLGDWRLEVGTATGRLPVTTTDANLVLGRLDADHFLGGTMRLDGAAAREALSELAAAMGVSSIEAAAWGVIRVANANMERAIRRISVERGHDPRRFTLLAFGGAGPLHACELAEDLQIPRVMIPGVPGVLSALGMLVASPTKDYSQTVMVNLNTTGTLSEEWLPAQFEPLERRAMAEMAAEGHDRPAITLHHALDMRYKGQSHELTVPFELSVSGDELLESFHLAHQVRFGYRRSVAGIEIVNLRLTAVATVRQPVLSEYPPAGEDARAACIGEKQVWFNEEPMATLLYDRGKLDPGNQLHGPAVVFQYDTTTVIPPNWSGEIDTFGNMILTIS